MELVLGRRLADRLSRTLSDWRRYLIKGEPDEGKVGVGFLHGGRDTL